MVAFVCACFGLVSPGFAEEAYSREAMVVDEAAPPTGFGAALAGEEHIEESFIPRFSVAGAYVSWSDEAGLSDGGGSVSKYRLGADVAVPLIMNERFKLTAGAIYRFDQFDFDGVPEPLGGGSLELHRAELPLNLWTDHSEKWKSWLRFQPGLASDFENVSGDDLTLTALALLAYKYSDTLTFAGGAYYSRDLGDSTVLPALGFIWEPSPRWIVGITAPRLEIIHAPTRDWLITANAFPSGGGWNVSGVSESGEDVDFNYSAIRTSLGIDRRLTGRLWGFVDLGYEFAQEIELDGAGEDFSEDLDGNFFFNAGVKLRF